MENWFLVVNTFDWFCLDEQVQNSLYITFASPLPSDWSMMTSYNINKGLSLLCSKKLSLPLQSMRTLSIFGRLLLVTYSFENRKNTGLKFIRSLSDQNNGSFNYAL